MSNVDIKKGKVGPSLGGSKDGTSGLIATSVSVATKLDYGKHYLISNPAMAELLGVNAEYDKTNKVRLYHHIREFYRIAPEGTDLHIMIVEQDKSMSEILLKKEYTLKLINEAEGEIRQLGVSLNPASGYTDTLVDGLNSDVSASIAKAQTFAQSCYSLHRPLQVLLEGRSYSGTSASALDLKAIPDVEASKVSVVIGQDWNFASKQDSIGQKYAAIGTALGSVAKVKVNQNIGENESMNITDAGKEAFVVGGLSSHQRIKDVEAEWGTLDAKHYIFPMREIGLPGLRWNNDHTCIKPSIDADGNINEHTISLGRTIDKASRLLRSQLLPKVKTVQNLDAKTGLLPLGTIKYFEGLGNNAFDLMEKAGEISQGKTIVDPASDLLNGDKALNVSFSLVPFGTINEIKGVINLKNKL